MVISWARKAVRAENILKAFLGGLLLREFCVTEPKPKRGASVNLSSIFQLDKPAFFIRRMRLINVDSLLEIRMCWRKTGKWLKR